MDVDPQHHVFLGLVHGSLAAYRYKRVPAGTRVYYGAKSP